MVTSGVSPGAIQKAPVMPVRRAASTFSSTHSRAPGAAKIGQARFRAAAPNGSAPKLSARRGPPSSRLATPCACRRIGPASGKSAASSSEDSSTRPSAGSASACRRPPEKARGATKPAASVASSRSTRRSRLQPVGPAPQGSARPERDSAPAGPLTERRETTISPLSRFQEASAWAASIRSKGAASPGATTAPGPIDRRPATRPTTPEVSSASSTTPEARLSIPASPASAGVTASSETGRSSTARRAVISLPTRSPVRVT